MDPQLAKLLQLTSLYGTLAMYYEHMDPEKHIYFYKKHFEVESQLVQYYWSLQQSMRTQTWGESTPE